MNCNYWDARYPRLFTKKFAKKLYRGEEVPWLKVIGDISCDIGGGIECTVKATDPGNPVFVFDISKQDAVDGFKGDGPVIMSVDNLPCELAKESSEAFSEVLVDFVPEIAKADFNVSFDDVVLPAPIKSAMILYHGELTPDFEYIAKYLK